MGTTPTNNAGTPVEEEYKLVDDGAGDPIDAGAIRYVSDRFRLRDNNGVHYDTDVRASATDTTPRTLSEKLVGDGIVISTVNTGNDEDVKLTTSSTSPGPYTFYIDAGLLGRNDTAGEETQFDYHCSEFKHGYTNFGSHTVFWTRTPTTTVKFYVLFTPKDFSSGTKYVRIAAKIKANAPGESCIGAFDAESFVVVDVTGVAAGTVAPMATITFTYPTVLSTGDSVSFFIGRDGHNDMGAGTNDNFPKNIFIQCIAVEVT